ncbi:DRTGG domain-containing protein [Fusibacter sp. 3D3]|uniref:DRTGG domain-containing protein n=1 Tax=Fusibacter sp. 3D3 TaxID=1048380 RepID=UPI0008537E4E|nr:DRTGG domain-containing protein [Fusibacter sp. 3D3]GAU78024.1 DRTGG domain-containing protein [Fusibacter sp. 3D3]
MQLKYIMELIEADVVAHKSGVEYDVQTAFGSDLMSDVLAYVEEDTLLITGLTNQQVIRTAEMLDLKAILFVRGKIPCSEVINLAEEKQIVLMTTKQSLFNVSGVLYQHGLSGIKL